MRKNMLHVNLKKASKKKLVKNIDFQSIHLSTLRTFQRQDLSK